MSKVEFAGTVAVGLVPDRQDGLVSLHVDSTVILLNGDEARSLANDLLKHAQTEGHKAPPNTPSNPYDAANGVI